MMMWFKLLLVFFCCSAVLCSPDDVNNYNFVDVKTDWSVSDLGLLENCGISATASGDSAVSNQRFPWLVKLLYTDPKHEECSGVLITGKFVLTSRHCILSQELNAVLVGEYDATKNWNEAIISPSDHVARLSIHDKIMHPTSNIGLIRLSEPVHFNKTWVHPICLPWNKGNVPRNTVGEVDGWMHIDQDRTLLNDAGFHVNQMTVVPKPKCRSQMSLIMDIQHDEFCAKSESTGDTCRGVAGGPFTMERKTRGVDTFFTVGIQTFERETCDSTQPIMFTSVGYHMDWILDNLAPIYEVWISNVNLTHIKQ